MDNNTQTRKSRFKTHSPALAAVAVTSLLYLSAALAPVNNALHDISAWLTTRVIPSDLVIVEIDARSLRALPSWPWPRGYHAQVIDRLLAAGARRLFVDIDFSSSSVPEEDQKLEAALARGAPGQVLLPAFHQPATSGSSQLLLMQPLERFRRHADLVSVNVRPGRDALVRKISLREPEGREALHSVAAVLNDWHDPPLADAWIDFSIAPQSFARLSYADVMAGRFPTDSVKDKLVVIGATAVELGDMVPVPLYRSLPGVVVQALAYQSVNSGTLWHTGHWQILTICLLAAVCLTPIYRRVSWRWGLFTSAFLALTAFAIQILLLQGQRLLLDTAPIILVIALAYLFQLLARLDQQSVRLWWQKLELIKKEQLITNIVGNSLDAILTINEDGAIESMNPAAEDMFHCTRAAFVGRSINTFIPQLVDEQDTGIHWNEGLISGQVHELTARTSAGDVFPIDLAMSRMEVEGNPLITAIVRDISVRKEQEAQLRYRATHDSLTDLPNRDLLASRITEAIHQTPEQTAALLMLDLNQLKEINDTLGHDIGDVVLKQVGARFASAVPDNATLARIGGDEFAVFVQTDHKAAVDLAQRLLDSLKQPFYAKGIALRTAVSIGIAYYPEHGERPNLLLQHADVAMYVAKRSSAGYETYDPALDHNTLRRLKLAGKLRSAIEHGCFIMYYQPIIRLDGHPKLGVEGLVRWQDPEFGLVMPDEFIELAETSDLIGSLTDWTLNQSLAQCVGWRHSGHDAVVAVNISARLMQDAGFPEALAKNLDKHGADPDWLTVEITENAFMSDPERARQTTAQINRLGMQLAIDDFGTGYSSFAYLKNLPVHELKIDKSFIFDMSSSQKDEFIVDSIITLAHGLDLQVVAEGVETEETYRQLLDMGCDLAQGYWISRPVAADDVIPWWKKWHGRQLNLPAEAPVRAHMGGS